MKEYPHQFSGGMIQRVMIAMGTAFDPKLLIADEITKGLDIPTKWKIVDFIKKVIKDQSMLIITHDLSVARKICDRIAVMYAGEIVEINKTENIFDDPGHPYTKGLLNSLPSAGLKPIPGTTPSLTALPPGCRFYPRCNVRRKICAKKHTKMRKLRTGCYVRCFG